jgi:hypothetical protein
VSLFNRQAAFKEAKSLGRRIWGTDRRAQIHVLRFHFATWDGCATLTEAVIRAGDTLLDDRKDPYRCDYGEPTNPCWSISGMSVLLWKEPEKSVCSVSR